jgi:hypothetical protein
MDQVGQEGLTVEAARGELDFLQAPGGSQGACRASRFRHPQPPREAVHRDAQSL